MTFHTCAFCGISGFYVTYSESHGFVSCAQCLVDFEEKRINLDIKTWREKAEKAVDKAWEGQK